MNTNKPEAYSALLTPEGEGGIAVIAVRGKNAPAAAKRLFNAKRILNWVEPFLAYGQLLRNGVFLDESLVENRPGDIPEVFINVHGGPQIVLNILEALQGEGVERLESSREYQRRAALEEQRFWNFEIELALEQAAHPAQVRFLLEQKNLWPEFVARLESANDLTAMRASIHAVLSEGEKAQVLLQPRKAALVGPVNAGKSTLFNRLAGVARAIVSEMPGTTRDAVRELMDCGGLPIELLDTAGLWETALGVDATAAQRSLKFAFSADLLLLIGEAKNGGAEFDPEKWRGFNGQIILVLNKSDQPSAPVELAPIAKAAAHVLKVSGLTGAGVPELVQTLARCAAPNGLPTPGETAFVSERQKILLRELLHLAEQAPRDSRQRQQLVGRLKGAPDLEK